MSETEQIVESPDQVLKDVAGMSDSGIPGIEPENPNNRTADVPVNPTGKRHDWFGLPGELLQCRNCKYVLNTKGKGGQTLMQLEDATLNPELNAKDCPRE